MIIYNEGNLRILQHPHLQYFHVQAWMLGDCARSYNQVYNWFTVLETRNIKEVNDFVSKKLKELKDE